MSNLRSRSPGPLRAGAVSDWLTATALAALLTVLAACTASAPSPSLGPTAAESRTLTPSTPSASSVPSSAVPVTGTVAPLTGLPISSAARGRAVLALPISGTAPVGLNLADVVIEEFSSPVRYLALFQSRDVGPVGPITDTRPSDPMLLGVFHALYGYRGGPNGMVEQIVPAGLTDAGYLRHPSAYGLRGNDIYASTASLYQQGRAPSALQMFPYSAPGTRPVGGRDVRQVVVTIPGRLTQTWKYDSATRRWARIGGGPAISVTNLLLQTVPYKLVKPIARSETTVPSARVLGTGAATVLTGPYAAAGRWSKAGIAKLTNYGDASGVSIRLTPGTSWVALLPAGSTVHAT